MRVKYSTQELRKMRDDGMTYQQISNIVGMTKQAVHSRINYESHSMTPEQRLVYRHYQHVSKCPICNKK